MPTTRGFSLPEVVIALGVLALLLAAAAPSFRGLLLEARMTTAVNELVHTAHLAHQAAQAHDRDIVVCRSTDGEQCAPPGNWAAGWMVFVNRDRDDPPVADPGEPVLHASSAHLLTAIDSNRHAFVMRPFPLRSTNGTVVFCDVRGGGDARAVIISYSGRPRLARRSAAGNPLLCPA